MQLILLADPDEDTRRILSLALAHEKFGVLQAETAERAKSLAAARAPDLIVLNYPMRLHSGESLTRSLRRAPQSHHMPVLNFTSRVTPEAIADAAADGVSVTLSKPATLDAVVDTIRQLLQRVRPGDSHHVWLNDLQPIGEQLDDL